MAVSRTKLTSSSPAPTRRICAIAGSARTSDCCSRRRSRPCDVRAPRRSAWIKSGRDARIAGHRPNTSPAISVTAQANANARVSIVTSFKRGSTSGAARSTEPMLHHANRNPSTSLATASRLLSIKHLPNDASARRAEREPHCQLVLTPARARASSRFATLTQSMSNRNVTASIKINNNVELSPMVQSCSACTRVPTFMFVRGQARASCAEMVSSSACAAATGTPGLSLASTGIICAWRLVVRSPGTGVPCGMARRPSIQTSTPRSDDGSSGTTPMTA